jgi:uroporphyrinogen decarboxylase
MGTMNSRERFLAACRRQPLDRPPLWVMRQAGRYLPEYRALKEKHGFLEMVQTPELACEVTLQPIRRFGMDAAILFSDILVVCEAMGQPYRFRDTGGIEMDFAVDSAAAIEKLETGAIRERLAYVDGALRLLRRELGAERALLGFAGSPWTLASYMVEGGSSKNYSRIKRLFFEERELFDALLAKITRSVIEYFDLQIEAGADALQIFDSWGGVLSERTFWYASAQWMAEIVESVGRRVPVILYAKGAHAWVDDLIRTGAEVYGVDWTIPISRFHDSLGGLGAVQGNLDPALMSTSPSTVRAEAEWILEDFGARKGHIFNLGHGIHPDARIDCVEALVETVQSWKGTDR